MARFTRGFTGRRHADRDPRLPPGQYDTGEPVAGAHRGGHAPARPRRPGRSRSRGWSSSPTTWTWDEIHALPPSTYEGDIHCVTTWSKLGVTFGGRLGRHPARGGTARCPTATHVLAFSHTGYTTNLPLADVTGGQGLGRVGLRRPAAARSTTAARPGCSCPTSTSGRAPSGWPACGCSTTTSRASGSATATTTAATPGSSSATRGTEMPDVPSPTCRCRPVADGDGGRRSAPRRRTRRRYRLALPEPSDHLAGQHYVVRLTAPDGYTATRSYSVASAPDGSNEIELTVERLEDGEVSTFLHDVVEPGDELDVRGPIGGWFVWDGRSPAAPRGRWIGRRPAHGDAPAGAAAAAPRPRPPRRVRAVAGRPLLRGRAARAGDDDRLHPKRPGVGPPAPGG